MTHFFRMEAVALIVGSLQCQSASRQRSCGSPVIPAWAGHGGGCRDRSGTDPRVTYGDFETQCNSDRDLTPYRHGKPAVHTLGLLWLNDGVPWGLGV